MILVRLSLTVGMLYTIWLAAPWWVTLLFTLLSMGSEVQALIYKEALRRADRAEATLRQQQQTRDGFDYARLAEAMARHDIHLTELRASRARKGLES